MPALLSATTSRLAVAVVSAAGGVGKSTISQCLECVATLAGKAVSIVDADPANAGHTIETADRRATKIRAIIDQERSAMGVRGYVDQLVSRNCDVVIIDGGAALTSMDPAIVDGFRDTCEVLVEQGFPLVSLIPVVSSKGQSRTQVQTLLQRLGRLGEVAVALTDPLGTGHYPDWLAALEPAQLHVARLAPGFVDLRRREVTALSDFMRIADPEFTIAHAAWAQACVQLVSQPPLINHLASWDLSLLNDKASRAPNSLAENPSSAADALTSVIETKKEYFAAQSRLYNAARHDVHHPAHHVVLARDAWFRSCDAASKRFT